MEIDWDAVWSPDGSKLAITVQTGPKEMSIDLVDLASGAVVRVDGPGVDEQPAWSPDGRHLVFTSSRAGGEADIWRVRADGTGAAPVTSGPAPEWLPRWVR